MFVIVLMMIFCAKIYIYVAYTYTILTKFQNTTKNVFRVPGTFMTMGLDHSMTVWFKTVPIDCYRIL